MAEWVVCPSCNLRHSMRADGICPRCKNPVGAAADGTAAVTPQEAPPGRAVGPASAGARPCPVAPRVMGAASPAALPDVYDGSLPPRGLPVGATKTMSSGEPYPIAARIAGGVLILNALARFAEMALISLPGGATPQITSAAIDLLLGVGMLFFCSEGALRWSRIRVAAGLLIFPTFLLWAGSPILAANQALFSGALLALLIGRAGTQRALAGTAVVTIYLIFEGLILIGPLTSTGPLARFFVPGGIESGTVTSVTGEVVPYSLTFPAGHWRARQLEAARKESPDADRWLIYPERNAHVIVIAKKRPDGRAADIGQFREYAKRHTGPAIHDFEWEDAPPLSTSVPETRLLHVHCTIQDVRMEGYYAFFVNGPETLLVEALAAEGSFGELKGELDGILASVTLS